MPNELTTRQQEILDYVREYIAREGMPPTVREACSHFGFSSLNAIISQFRAMEKKGVLRNTPRCSRAWRPA